MGKGGKAAVHLCIFLHGVYFCCVVFGMGMCAEAQLCLGKHFSNMASPTRPADAVFLFSLRLRAYHRVTSLHERHKG